MEFEPHGLYRIAVHDRVVVLIPSGPHNLESFQSYIRDFKAVIKEVEKNGSWALLVIAVNNLIMPPVAETVMRAYIRSVGKRGKVPFVAQSFEYITDNSKGVTRAQWERVSRDLSGVTWEFFSRTDDGIRWLREKGYSCELSDDERQFIDSQRPAGD